tara:strand:+ start:14756 stop:16288 length:1533 start_codon:yes stop_codon:yes gene_type:complete
MAITQSTGTFGSAPKGINNNLYALESPTKYTSLYDFIDEVNAPDVRAKLSKSFGNQGISGFLKMTGAIKNNGTADNVQYFEEARLHQVQRATVKSSLEDDNSTEDSSGALGDITGGITFQTVVAADGSFTDASSVQLIVREGDIILVNGVDRMIVVGDNAAGDAIDSNSTEFHAKPLVGDAPIAPTVTITVGDVLDMPIIGNMFNQGTDQPNRFIESNVVKRTNPYAIVKESFEVSGSQATNIGYVDVGGGDFRWYIKGEMDTRQRFMDKREMIMLLGQVATNDDADAGLPKTNNGGFDANVAGTEGYFSALEDRGMVTSDLLGATGLGDLDELIREMDKNGCPAEYAVYSATAQDLLLDDMVAGAGSGIGGVTSGVAASFGAFNNDRDMALNLGFKSFSRGGYTFHKNSFKLLNDPTLLGNEDVHNRLAAGVMIPLANVVDPRSGERAPALEMNFKSAGGYSREMEHWVTGGGVLGFTNDTNDSAKFHYRSECCLVTRSANQHVLIQGS